LNSLFEHLSAATVVLQIEALLPWNLKAVLGRRENATAGTPASP